MKGLIRQQISRLPFKYQASIQRDARGRKAARVAENGAIYNQSHKSHSSAQPGAASSLYWCRTREPLNQPLLKIPERAPPQEGLSSSRTRTRTRALCRSPQPLRIDRAAFCLLLAAERREAKSFLLPEEEGEN